MIAHRLPRMGPIPQPYPRPWQIHDYLGGDRRLRKAVAPYLPARSRGVLYSRIAMSAVDIYTVALNEWADWGAS